MVLYYLFFENSSSDNFVDTDNSENVEDIVEPEEVEEPTEEPEEVEEPTEVPEEVEEPTEEPEEVEEPTEEPEEVEEPSDESEEVEESTEELEEVSQSVSVNVSYNGVATPLFVDNMTITIFLLSVLIGVALFGIFKSKL